MLRPLYLFNPDHDLALANGDRNFTPPAAARQLANDLAILPAWYATEGSAVLAPLRNNLAFLDNMSKTFSSLAHLLSEQEIKDAPHVAPLPWGWNPAICKRLQALNIPQANMPAEAELKTLRQNSHRRHAAKLLEKLQLDNAFCGESLYLTDINELKAFVENHKECLLKAPLSGSGKGLNWCRDIFTHHIEHWCLNIIAQQGGVMAEPIYNKVVDFAMEFRADADGSIHFAGYSLFFTKGNGIYESNLLMADEEMERYLSLYIPNERLITVQKRLEVELSRLIAGSYRGYLGVDMMICRFSEPPEYRLHPCVEINLRMNMGMVARIIYDNYLVPGAIGMFSIDYAASPDELRKHHQALSERYPLKADGGRIAGGYLPLVPVTEESRYLAWVLVLN